jgi:hypothetical protein
VNDRLDAWPRIQTGATVTSWRGSPEFDPDALFAGPANGPAIAGVAARERKSY